MDEESSATRKRIDQKLGIERQTFGPCMRLRHDTVDIRTSWYGVLSRAYTELSIVLVARKKSFTKYLVVQEAILKVYGTYRAITIVCPFVPQQ